MITKNHNPNTTTLKEWSAYIVFIAGFLFAFSGEAHYERAVEALKQTSEHNSKVLSTMADEACTQSHSEDDMSDLRFSRLITSDSRLRELIPLAMEKNGQGYKLTFLEYRNGELVQGEHKMEPFHVSPYQGRFSNLFSSDPRIHADAYLGGGVLNNNRSINVALKKSAHLKGKRPGCHLVELAKDMKLLKVAQQEEPRLAIRQQQASRTAF